MINRTAPTATTLLVNMTFCFRIMDEMKLGICFSKASVEIPDRNQLSSVMGLHIRGYGLTSKLIFMRV